MNLKAHPTEIAATLLERSVCSVQVGSCIQDSWGVFSWGWNSSGPDGLGEHAEQHCIRRANRSRFGGATMYIAAKRRRNGRMVTAKPCPECLQAIQKRGLFVVYRDGFGEWKLL